MGELDGKTTERIQKMSEMMGAAGFKSLILDDIRSEIWLKLWGNMTFNPISSLTHGTLEGICQYPLTKELARNMMAEAQTIAEKLGVHSAWILSVALRVLRKWVSTRLLCCKLWKPAVA